MTFRNNPRNPLSFRLYSCLQFDNEKTLTNLQHTPFQWMNALILKYLSGKLISPLLFLTFVGGSL